MKWYYQFELKLIGFLKLWSCNEMKSAGDSVKAWNKATEA